MFSIFSQLAKMASTSSVSCPSDKTVHYSMEQTVSTAVDDQSLNVLTADSDSGSVWDFLCWLYRERIVNKLCRNTKHVHSINSVTSKSDFNLRINTHFVLRSVVFKLLHGWIRLDEWLRRYVSKEVTRCFTPSQPVQVYQGEWEDTAV